MWGTTTSSNSTAVTAVALSMIFSTHAAINIDNIRRDEIYISNVCGQKWSSIGIKEDVKETEPQLQSIADIVDLVKVELGLPNKDIANIFRVSRQTLHAYKHSTDMHTVNTANMERAFLLANVIDEIRAKFNRSPGAMAKNYVMDGKSLLDLLSESELNIPNIVRISNNLAEKMTLGSLKDASINEISLHQLTSVA